MSRSYKHTIGIVKDPANKASKRFANKAVRRYKGDLPSHGKAYKKLYQSYDISDFWWIWTKEDAIKEWEKDYPCYHYKTHFQTLEQWLNYWYKCTQRK